MSLSTAKASITLRSRREQWPQTWGCWFSSQLLHTQQQNVLEHVECQVWMVPEGQHCLQMTGILPQATHTGHLSIFGCILSKKKKKKGVKMIYTLYGDQHPLQTISTETQLSLCSHRDCMKYNVVTQIPHIPTVPPIANMKAYNHTSLPKSTNTCRLDYYSVNNS